MNVVSDKNGDFVTTKDKIEEATLEIYSEVLEKRKIAEGIEKHKLESEELCSRQVVDKNEITRDWSVKDVEVVVKQLKNIKSRDPYG